MSRNPLFYKQRINCMVGLNMPGVVLKRLVAWFLIFFLLLDFCDDVFFPLDDEFVGVVCGALLLACSSELLTATDLKM